MWLTFGKWNDMINFAVKSDSNDKNLNYVNIKKCLTKHNDAW